MIWIYSDVNPKIKKRRQTICGRPCLEVLGREKGKEINEESGQWSVGESNLSMYISVPLEDIRTRMEYIPGTGYKSQWTQGTFTHADQLEEGNAYSADFWPGILAYTMNSGNLISKCPQLEGKHWKGNAKEALWILLQGNILHSHQCICPLESYIYESFSLQPQHKPGMYC